MGSRVPAGMEMESDCRSGGDRCSNLQDMTVEYQRKVISVEIRGVVNALKLSIESLEHVAAGMHV